MTVTDASDPSFICRCFPGSIFQLAKFAGQLWRPHSDPASPAQVTSLKEFDRFEARLNILSLIQNDLAFCVEIFPLRSFSRHYIT